MDEIKIKINENGIVYEGENAWLRERKLREVTNEYAKKYKQELPEALMTDAGLPQMIKIALGFFEKVDSEISMGHDPTWLPLGHYIVMIVDGTHLLRRCYDDGSYRALSNYK